MNDLSALPAVRPLQATPFRQPDGRLLIELRDMQQIAPQVLAVSPAAYFLLAQLDGRRSVVDLQESFRRETGQPLPREEIEGLVRALDENLMLLTPRFEAALAEQRAAYDAAPTRDNRDRWPDAQTLRSLLEPLLETPPVEVVGRIRGLIAPHLDYPRGKPCYAAAYGLLARSSPAERYVILGTNHFGLSRSVVATRKDFETPFGRVTTDRAFIDRLQDRLGADLCSDELDHRAEHSIELQVHLLQVCYPDHDFELVPLLCPDVCGQTGTAPANGTGPDLGALADALRELASQDSRSTVFIASADLSHVGLAFGDAERATKARLRAVEEHDLALLQALEDDDTSRFLSLLRATSNSTNVCSTGCLFAFRRALAGHPLKLLRYHQAVDPASDTNVTCAAAVVT